MGGQTCAPSAIHKTVEEGARGMRRQILASGNIPFDPADYRVSFTLQEKKDVGPFLAAHSP